jgi:hypothetical protein
MPHQRKNVLVLDRDEPIESAKVSLVISRRGLVVIRDDNIFVLNLGKQTYGQFLKSADIMASGHTELHDVGRIPLLMEGEESFSDAFLLQRLEVSAVEPVKNTLRVRLLLNK